MFNKFRKPKTDIHFEGFQEEENKRKQSKDYLLNIRIVALFFVVALLFIILGTRLSLIQVNQKELYEVKLDTYGVSKFEQDASRGIIVDREGVPLVTNTNSINAVFYPSDQIDDLQIELIANFMLEHCKVKVDDISIRQKKDYFLIAYPDIVNDLITEQQKDALVGDNLDYQLYLLQINTITEELMDKYMNDETLFKTKLIHTMTIATGKIVTILENLTVKEASVIGEHSNILKGVQIQTDWQRVKMLGGNLSGVLGRVSTKQQGLPLESRDELLSLGLQNDSRVGLSGLEAQYDSLLRGVNASYMMDNDKYGTTHVTSLSSGTSGTNLRLSIDWELQEYANQVLTDTLIANAHNPYFKELFFVLMDPNNGDVIVMAGKQIDRETGEVSDYADGNYKSAYLIGSTTKGASLYCAYKNDLTTPGEVISDDPIKIKGTQIKKSWTPLGPMTDVRSLARSANTFYFHMAIRLGGGVYQYDQPLVLDPNAFDTYRRDLGELGLGVKTGIDVPEESLGYRGSYDSRNSGLLLDFFIGQYDSYTNIQLAQYTATLANMGKRVQPRLVTSGYEVATDGTINESFVNKVEILDDVSYEELAFERIKLGFGACVTDPDGLCRTWAPKTYDVWAKTGTAQVFEYINGTQVDYANNTQIGWAGTEENPQVIFSTIAPRSNLSLIPVTVSVSIVDKYFEKYGIE